MFKCNGFMADGAYGRMIYSRSIVTLSEGGVLCGHGTVMIAPSSVARLAAAEGAEAYHGARCVARRVEPGATLVFDRKRQHDSKSTDRCGDA